MLKIDRNKQSLSTLESPSLADASITERYDLQEFIFNSPDAFFRELGEELFLIDKELAPSTTVQDRIDILAVDKEGVAVIVELKRGNHKLHMLQAISYAGMISQWEPEEFDSALSDEQQEALSEFLECDKENINRKQRVILVAEAYDYALLVGVAWLSEKFNVNINCCRVALATDAATNTEYLVCSTVYPSPELASESVARGRGSRTSHKSPWSDWKTALDNLANPHVVRFFETELQTGRESYLRKRILHFRIDGKRRWFVAARKSHTYVWQTGRFDNDLDFWAKRLSQRDKIEPVKNSECLRMFLETESDLNAFHKAATSELLKVAWSKGPLEDDIDT